VSTVTVPRSNVTKEEVSKVLRIGLGPRYHVTAADDPDAMVVGTNRVIRAHIRIVPRDNYAEIRVSPGGLVWDRLINTFGIARKVREVLREAPELGGSM
jgi:hypothetical protein